MQYISSTATQYSCEMPQHVSRAFAARGLQRQRNCSAAPQGGTSDADEFNAILQKICYDLADGREPFLAFDDSDTLASQLEDITEDGYTMAKNWIARKPIADKMVALYALALRRSLYSTLTDDEMQVDYAWFRIRGELQPRFVPHAGLCAGRRPAGLKRGARRQRKPHQGIHAAAAP